MKKTIKKIAIAALALSAFVFAVYSCVTMDSPVFSANPATAGEVVTIKSHVNLNPKTDQSGVFVVGLILPEIIGASDITATYTTTGMMASQGIADVTDSPMTVDNALVEVTTGKDYSTALYGKYGDMGNARGGVTWVTLKGEPYYALKGNENALIDAYVTIKVKLPASNIKFNTAVSATLSDTGFKTDDFGDYWGISAAATLVVNGAEGGATDYTVLPLTSTVPAKFRYGDFFAVKFSSKVGDDMTALYDQTTVHMLGEAHLEDGSIVKIDKISDKTLMKRISDANYSKYVFATDYFGLKKGTKIDMIYFYFCNYDGSIVVCPEGMPGYEFPQCNH